MILFSLILELWVSSDFICFDLGFWSDRVLESDYGLVTNAPFLLSQGSEASDFAYGCPSTPIQKVLYEGPNLIVRESTTMICCLLNGSSSTKETGDYQRTLHRPSSTGMDRVDLRGPLIPFFPEPVPEDKTSSENQLHLLSLPLVQPGYLPGWLRPRLVPRP